MRKKLLIAPALVLVLGTATGVTWWLLQPPESSGRTMTLYGNIEIRDAQLAFIEQEHIAEVLVEEGDVVAKDEVLARLVRDRLDDQLAEAEASLEAQRQIVRRLVAGTRPQEIAQARAGVVAAEARVRNAQVNVERIAATAKTGASSRQGLDDAKAALEVEKADLDVRQQTLNLALEGPRQEDIAEAKATLAARQAGVDLLRHRLEDTVLRSPAAGVIQSRILEPGEMASPTRPAFVLALTDPKWVRTYVSEPDLGHIDRGMKARVLSDSFPGEPIDGWVGFISPVAEFTPKSVETTDLRTRLVYEVRVYVHDPENRLRLGMPVTVEIDRGATAVAPEKPVREQESVPATAVGREK